MRHAIELKTPARQCTDSSCSKEPYTEDKKTITYRLTGSRCQCSVCGELFNSVSVFDRHRKGAYLEHTTKRQCLTIDQMVVRGWIKNAQGFWIQRLRGDLQRRIADFHRPCGVIAGCNGDAVNV